MVHYGHSCLIPIQETQGVQMLYVFVDIQLNCSHLVDTLRANFTPTTTIALVSTIQFVRSLQVSIGLKFKTWENFINTSFKGRPKNSESRRIQDSHPSMQTSESRWNPGLHVTETSQRRGRTSVSYQKFKYSRLFSRLFIDSSYLGDGRFHLESIMISNPSTPAYQYDPYSRKFTREYYDFQSMVRIRSDAIEKARKAKKFGLILGTLGRQGNPKILEVSECSNNSTIRI